MKKKYKNYRKAMVVIFLLTNAFGVFPLIGNAQENNPPNFAIVECMKVKPENENRYLELEKNIWKPLHLERAKQGIIAGWILFKVRFTGTDDKYNYVTVTFFTDPQKIEDPWNNIDPSKILPGKDLDAAMKETDESRDLISGILINRQAFVYPEGSPGGAKYLQIDYMKVEQGKEAEYTDVETNIWKPVHNEFIKAGSRVGWSFWGRVFPSGSGQEFQYITVNYFKDWSKIGAADYTDAFNKAHPGKDINALSERTGASRNLVKSELWEYIDRAFAQ